MSLLFQWLSQFSGKSVRKIVEFSASSWQLVDLQRWQTRDLKQLQIANGACHNGPQTGSAGMTLLLCTHSLRCCWPKGRTYFRNDIWDWRLETGLETGSAAGLSGNYATDLVRGMRGANLSEVEAVFCCYSSLLFLLFFGQQMLKASDRFFDNLIYGTSSSAWVDEVATCIDLQLASTSHRSSGLLSLSPAFGLCVNCFCWPHSLQAHQRGPSQCGRQEISFVLVRLCD